MGMTVSFNLPVIEASLGFIKAMTILSSGVRQVYASGRHQARAFATHVRLSKQLVQLSNRIEKVIR